MPGKTFALQVIFCPPPPAKNQMAPSLCQFLSEYSEEQTKRKVEISVCKVQNLFPIWPSTPRLPNHMWENISLFFCWDPLGMRLQALLQ